MERSARGSFVRAALPWRTGVTEEHLHAQGVRHLVVEGHFPAAIPRQRPTKLRRHVGEILDESVPDGVSLIPVGQGDDAHQAGGAFDEGGHGGRALAHDEVTFPMADFGPVFDAGGSIVDGCHVPQHAAALSGFRDARVAQGSP